VALEKSRGVSLNAWISPEKNISDEKKGDEDWIAQIDFGIDNDNREEGEPPVNFVDELNYVDSPDASSSGVDDFRHKRYENSHNYPNEGFASCEYLHEYSSGKDMGLVKPHSAPAEAFHEGKNNPAAEIKVAFRRAVIMSPRLNRSFSDEDNGLANSSIRRNSFSRSRIYRNSPKKVGARLSRVDEENRVSEMAEKEIEYSNSSVKLYHKRKRSIIRRLSQSTEEVRSPSRARRRSLYAQNSQPKKGMRRSSCVTRFKIPGAEPWIDPEAQASVRQLTQPGAQPAAKPPPGGGRGSFFKLSLNDLNER